MSDTYTQILTEMADRIENSYKLKDEEGLLDERIDNVMKSVVSTVKKLTQSEITKRNAEAFDCLSVIAHLNGRMEFSEHLRLDFRKFPHKDKILTSLEYFTKRSNLNTKLNKQVDSLVQVLDFIDRKRIDLRHEMSYRYLRIFIVMIVYASYAEVSIVADLLYNQMKRSG